MDLQTAVAVSLLPGSRWRVAAIFKELRQQNPSIPLEQVIDALGPPPEDRPRAEAAPAAARAALAAGQAAGMTPIAWFDPRYPALLNCIVDPPPVLWTRGQADVLNQPAVAIVGSRAATPYALDVAARLAAELAERRIAVVSGLARGVDSSAHRGCLAAGGATIAVLGSGLDRVYPAEHAPLAGAIAGTGVVVSELGPACPPLPEHFPQRNRIISGLSLAVVVVEASENSGSLITARCALDQGRDVMAVPGSVLTGRNRGSHSLLKDGAKIVETADDILEDLGFGGGVGTHDDADRQPGPGRTDRDPLVVHMEAGEVYELDDLVRVTGLTASKLLPRLMELELRGQVAAIGGGRFARSDPRR